MIGHVDYHVVDHCNFKCKGCNQFGPLAKPWCIPYDQFCEEWQFVKFKKLQIGELRILGGETLLHPRLGDLLVFLRKLFPTTSIVVYTNATLLPQQKEKLLPVFNENDICLFISAYPGLKLNYEELRQGFSRSIVGNEFFFMNTSLHRNPDFDQDEMFHNCNTGSVWCCRFLWNYHLYPCSMVPNIRFLIEHFSELKDTPLGQLNIEDNGIDIRIHSNAEIEEFLQHSIPACKFCNAINAKNFHQWGLTNYDISEWVEQ